eukprot:TRINITY_DN3_c0_g1_i1.p1 TRINITY_DN3_c0_g1~~TRINITY_DN3_c0_g1_i1.p1  ORF type:complete len:319 (+),score=80.42 TRINITY_DN3_c0_g1_i1:63-1019(+)
MSGFGGASFSPRVKGQPRPEYPPTTSMLKDLFLSSTRVPLVLTVLTYFLQPYWLMLVQCFRELGLNDSGIFTVSTMATHTITYCICNGFYYFLDTHKYLQQYKMHRTPAMEHSGDQFKHTLREAFVSQILLAPFIVYFAFDILLNSSFMQPDEELTDFTTLFFCYVAAKVVNSVGFYWAHRTVHHPALYWIHKQHHSYVGTIGVSAEYAHPIEQLVANQLPIALSVLPLLHPLPTIIWLWERLEQSYQVHSGYAFVGTLPHKLGLTHASGAAFHDFHHTINSGNFSEPWIDWLFGTMDPWLVQGSEEGYLARKDKSEN